MSYMMRRSITMSCCSMNWFCEATISLPLSVLPPEDTLCKSLERECMSGGKLVYKKALAELCKTAKYMQITVRVGTQYKVLEYFQRVNNAAYTVQLTPGRNDENFNNSGFTKYYTYSCATTWSELSLATFKWTTSRTDFAFNSREMALKATCARCDNKEDGSFRVCLRKEAKFNSKTEKWPVQKWHKNPIKTIWKCFRLKLYITLILQKLLSAHYVYIMLYKHNFIMKNRIKGPKPNQITRTWHEHTPIANGCVADKCIRAICDATK